MKKAVIIDVALFCIFGAKFVQALNIPEMRSALLFTTDGDVGQNAYQKIGAQLSALRSKEYPAISYKEIGDVAGADRRTVRGWVRGIAAPDLVQAKRLFDKYGWKLNA